jgi:pimeloyl-ACP methyl ester carboxylesterase
MPFADLGDVRLFYTDDRPRDRTHEPNREDLGDRSDPVGRVGRVGRRETALLLVHGWGADSNDWAWHIPELSATHRVIAPDLRGHGHSSDPGAGPGSDRDPASGYHPRALAADLVALLDHLGIERVVAIGHSMGGQIVSCLAVEHPERVRALVCVDPAYGQPAELAGFFAGLVDGLRTDAHATALRMDASIYTPATPPFLAAWHARKILATPPHVLTDLFAAMFTGADQFGLRPASDEYLAGRDCPVLTCWATAEPAAWEANLFKHPDSTAVSWPGAGHRLHEERPAEFLLVVKNWIAEVTT